MADWLVVVMYLILILTLTRSHRHRGQPAIRSDSGGCGSVVDTDGRDGRMPVGTRSLIRSYSEWKAVNRTIGFTTHPPGPYTQSS